MGKKYNRLTVIEEMPELMERFPSGAPRHYYRCICDCGNEAIVSKPAILGNHTKSCGCAKNGCQMEDLTGEVFNRLKVLRLDVDKNEKNRQRKKAGEIKGWATNWICVCECGNICSVSSYQLKTEHTKSCGCYQSEITSKRNRDTSTKINRVVVCKSNRCESEDSYVKIFSDTSDDFFIVDYDDYEYISRWFWRKDKKGYWVTNAKADDDFGKTMLRVHQLIAVRKFGDYDNRTYIPDHLNRNKSDNRKSNLELKTIADNARNRSLSKANTSGKTGVHWSKDKGLWTAYICVNYKNKQLGNFGSFEDAVNARLKAEEKYGYICDDNIPDNATVVIQETLKQGEVVLYDTQ
ncbi:MAG: HNH endonuclease signature motif containing protein [Peptostreptococcaceae bacterium]